MKQFKIRASAAGQIMTSDRSGDGLGKTAQSYCQTWLREQLYGRRKQVESKYLQRGNESEQDALDYVADRLGYGVLIKNEQFFENEFMCGTPDAILNTVVIDTKCAWSWETMPIFDTECKNNDYYYQAQCYMHMTGIHSFKLCYVLLDTPVHMIEKEACRWCMNNGYGGLDEKIHNDFIARMTYNDVPDSLKLKVFDITYSPDSIHRIEQRVILCREYISAVMHGAKLIIE